MAGLRSLPADPTIYVVVVLFSAAVWLTARIAKSILQAAAGAGALRRACLWCCSNRAIWLAACSNNVTSLVAGDLNSPSNCPRSTSSEGNPPAREYPAARVVIIQVTKMNLQAVEFPRRRFSPLSPPRNVAPAGDDRHLAR